MFINYNWCKTIVLLLFWYARIHRLHDKFIANFDQVRYNTTCNTECKLSWEREQFLNRMNDTCGAVSSWNGLPDNWEDLLHVQDSDLIPWNW